MSVYFLAHGTLVKIGKSADPDARAKALQTGAFLRVRLLAVAEIGSDAQSYDIERQLHEQFGWSRKRGEFFSMSKPLRELIAAVAAGFDVRDAMRLSAPECRRLSNAAHLLRSSKQTTPPVAVNARARRKQSRAAARRDAT
jgi:hypothetical protein